MGGRWAQGTQPLPGPSPDREAGTAGAEPFGGLSKPPQQHPPDRVSIRNLPWRHEGSVRAKPPACLHEEGTRRWRPLVPLPVEGRGAAGRAPGPAGERATRGGARGTRRAGPRAQAASPQLWLWGPGTVPRQGQAPRVRSVAEKGRTSGLLAGLPRRCREPQGPRDALLPTQTRAHVPRRLLRPTRGSRWRRPPLGPARLPSPPWPLQSWTLRAVMASGVQDKCQVTRQGFSNILYDAP